jgi:hypothetical protein
MALTENGAKVRPDLVAHDGDRAWTKFKAPDLAPGIVIPILVIVVPASELTNEPTGCPPQLVTWVPAPQIGYLCQFTFVVALTLGEIDAVLRPPAILIERWELEDRMVTLAYAQRPERKDERDLWEKRRLATRERLGSLPETYTSIVNGQTEASSPYMLELAIAAD